MAATYVQRDMSGRVCVVTGADSGIGLAASRRLAAAGSRVVMVCRDRVKAADARRSIVGTTGNDDVVVVLADLASLATVREAAEEIVATNDRVDVLANNAGAIMPERVITPDGNELTLQVDHLAHFLLTNLLLDRLKASPEARVITTSSRAHRAASYGIDMADLTYERAWSPFKAYSESKLANVLFTYELAARMRGTTVSANAFEPGGVRTSWGTGDWGLQGTFWHAIRPFLRTPEKGAETLVYLAVAQEIAGISGGYFRDMRPVEPSRAARDAVTARALWEESARLTGLA